MVEARYANAMAELLEYLKGIRKEDVDRIPKKIIEYFRENASKDYVCQFDYKAPLDKLNLLKETEILIVMICFKYWCRTEEQKKLLINRLNENERIYQEELRKKYNPDEIFKKEIKAEKENTEELSLVRAKKENIFKRIINKIKAIFKLT